ncbi:hypothetical protein [Microbacterium sp. NPDC057650]|uniref:hypothetical protein n=1 Tax=unclassified Microbacterium TaxID=2609290 RepID=UPI003670A9E9
MPEFELRFDERYWSIVPDEAGAPEWFAGLLAANDEEHHQALGMAASLAMETRVQSDLSALLLLAVPEAGAYGALSVLHVADAPPAPDEATAVQIAQSIEPSDWASSVAPFESEDVTGWRVSQATPVRSTEGDSASAHVVRDITMVWVLDVGAHLCIARMTPLPTLSAALLLPQIENVLASARFTGAGVAR